MTLPNLFLFAAGLAAMAIPVWAHLRQGRVKRRQVVSTLRLMGDTVQTSRAPRRLVDKPLLLLRLLVLLLLALGFGRLLVPLLGGGHAREYVVFVVDSSGSMRAKDGAKSVWNEARSTLAQAIDSLASTSRTALVLSPSAGEQGGWTNPGATARRVGDLRPGYAANRLEPALREAVALLGELPDDCPKVIHVVSDFQLSALEGLDSVSIPADVALRISKVGPESLPNRSVSVRVEKAGAAITGVYGFGDGGAGSLGLSVNGGAVSMHALDPESPAFRLARIGEPGAWVTRTLSIDGGDSFEVDDAGYDAFQGAGRTEAMVWEPRMLVPGQARVYDEWDDPDGKEPDSNDGTRRSATRARHEYEMAGYYLRRALAPNQGLDLGRESAFVVTSVDANALASSAKAVEAGKGESRLLLVPSTPGSPDGVAALARSVCQGGGAVVFFAGPDLDSEAYSKAFGDLLPVSIGKAEAVPDAVALAPVTSAHPVWGTLPSAWREALAGNRFASRLACKPADGARVVHAFADGVPFVASRPVGRGSVWFVNTSADRAWGDFVASPGLFVPVMHLLAAQALERMQPPSTLAVAGEVVRLSLPTSSAGRGITVGGRALTIDASGNVERLILDAPGVHDLVAADGSVAHRVAVNFPLSESVLESRSATVVRQRLESLRATGKAAAVRWEGADSGGLAWQLCLGLAAALMLIEPLVANRRAVR